MDTGPRIGTSSAPTVARQPAARASASAQARAAKRELTVLRYPPSTPSLAEIGRDLYVSPNTVKTQCRAIYRKLAVTGRRAAVQAAREHRLL